MAENILQCFVNDESPGSNLIEVNDLMLRCKHQCADMDTLNLVILQLVKDKKATVVNRENNERVSSKF